MGSGCSSACGCGDDTHPWKADSLADTLNTYALLNLTSQVIHFAVYQIQLIGSDARYARVLCTQVQPSERKLVPKPPLRLGYVRKGVICGVDLAEPAKLVDKTVWQRRFDDEPSTMNLETQHTLVAFESRAEPGAPLLLHLTNPPGYSLARLSNPLVSKLKEGKSEFMRSIREELAGDFPEYRHAGRTATVRYGTELCREEQQFLDRRLVRVRAALCRFLDMDLSDLPLDYIPRIGIAASGGGYRALIASMGVLIEFEKQGLLDCCTYLAGLSGGGWLVANIMSSPARTLAELKPHLQSRLSKPFYDLETSVALSEFRERLANNAATTIVDEYSWCLSQHLYQGLETSADLWHKPRLSEQARRIDGGQMPFPLYVAVAQPKSDIAAEQRDLRWVEMSPHEVGIREDVNSWIPSWSLGRKWQDGRSIDSATEPSLAMHCATIGAGFTASVDQILQNTLLREGKLQRIVHSFLTDSDIADSRMFSPAIYPNWAHKGPVATAKQLQITDAGLAFNLPIPPLLRPERKVDVIIALDQSAGREQFSSSHLTEAAQYARAHKYPFPDVSQATRIEGKLKDASRVQSTASLSPCTVCAGSPKDRVPSVIYMPLLRNTRFHLDFDPRESEFCATWSWVWTAEQVDLLSGLAAANAEQSMKQIKQHLRRVIEQKREMKRVENYKSYTAARSNVHGKSAAVAPAPVTPKPAASPTTAPMPHSSPTAASFRSGAASSLAGGGGGGDGTTPGGEDEVMAMTPVEGRSRTPSPPPGPRRRDPAYAPPRALESSAVLRSGSVVPASNSPHHRPPAASAGAPVAASSPHRSGGVVQRSRDRDSPPPTPSKGAWGTAAPTAGVGHARQMSAEGR